MYFRAGLVSFIFILLIAFTAAAPILHDNVDVASPADSGASLSHLTPLSAKIASPPTAFDVDNMHPSRNVFIPAAATVNGNSAVHRRNLDELERRNIFGKIKHACKKIGKSIKKAVKKIGSGIKKAAQKSLSGVKSVVGKTKQFIKANGAKIAKVGLKIVAAATKVGSKFVGYIPGVGKVLSKAMTRASSAANSASDHIHANIGGKLEKAMEGMDKAEKYAGYIPRELSKEYYFQEREFDNSFESLDARDGYEWESMMDARAGYHEWLYERDLEFTY